MSFNPVVTLVDEQGHSTDGAESLAIAAAAGTVVVSAQPGRLVRVLVTTAGTSGAVTFYDNASAASGTVIGVVPGSATAGTVFELRMPTANGITASSAASSAAVTVCHA